VNGALDMIAAVLAPENIHVAVTDTAEGAVAGRGPAWTSRRATVRIANPTELLAGITPHLLELERLHGFARDLEEQHAELRRLELKLSETKTHAAEIQAELEQLDAGSDDAAVTGWRARLREQVDAANEKLKHRQHQVVGQRAKLGGMRPDATPPAEGSPLEEKLKTAIAVERSVTYLAHSATVEAQLLRRVRLRRSARWAAVVLGAGLVVGAAVVIAARMPASPTALDNAKAEILEHPFLAPQLHDDEARALRAAGTDLELRRVYERVKDRLEAEEEPKAEAMPKMAWVNAIHLADAGPRHTKVEIDHEAALAVAGREAFGEGTKLDVGFGPVNAKDGGAVPLPVVEVDEILCSRGFGLQMAVTVELPRGTNFTKVVYLELGELAWRAGRCSNLPPHFHAGLLGH
jgi:hypothetical protein